MQDLVHSLLSPSPLGLVLAVLVAISIPLFLHLVVFRSSGLTTLPSILLLGPSGSGKTSLLTLVRSLSPISSDTKHISNSDLTPKQFERGSSAPTHTSQTPQSVECSLPVGTTAGSSKYRSVNDPSLQTYKKFLLIDTPGHGKLRHHALDNLTSPQNLKGIIFLVDAAAMTAGAQGVRQTAEYLHDVLLLLQKHMSMPKAPKETCLLLAANKLDLFTALPAALVKSALEAEITKVRSSRAKGLLDSGIGMGDDADAEDRDDWLGEMGDSPFKFSQMEEFGIYIEVSGGSVVGSEGPEVEKWWKWIGERL